MNKRKNENSCQHILRSCQQWHPTCTLSSNTWGDLQSQVLAAGKEVCRETWEMRLWMLKPETCTTQRESAPGGKWCPPPFLKLSPCLLLNTGDPVLAFLPTSTAPDSWVPMCTRHGSRRHRIHLGMKEALILPSERSQAWEVLKAVRCRLDSARVLASSDSASRTQALH